MHLNYSGPASVFSHILSSFGLTIDWLRPDGSWMAGILLPGALRAQELHSEVLESMMIVTSLFVDTAGNISFSQSDAEPPLFPKQSHVLPQLTHSPSPFSLILWRKQVFETK